MSLSSFPVSAALVPAGLAFGAAYFAALRHSVKLYSDGSGRLLISVLALGRIAAAAAFFGFAARLGALPALSALLGFLLARMLALRAAARKLSA
jgi:hypothetical protein